MARRSIEHPQWYESKSVTKQGGQQSIVQQTSRAKYENNMTGGYERYTAKETVSTGKQFVERSTGRVGFKDEQQWSFTLKIGDKSGYTEYYSEQKVQRVNFENSSSNTSWGKNKY
ncbi:hypothetical protein Vadar_007323 [Vaccinium darrowii]|uniref:Uncharacterized protein n=1 Tax=Vaccinium darrowii TaxID=229202 RepID=A0ACB7Z3Q6_9ERIC|nr:hypothetical protein Vadar_007323 [Vaccinium darrowii]